ncbi:MAG: sigma-70 family RNA polymerase sigma factor [Verrucomicrobiia bacterium]
MEGAENIPVNIPASVASNSAHEGAHAEPTDRELVERCQRGDLDSYEILVNRYRQRVYGLAYSMLRNEQDATDLSQETFVKAWQAIRGFKRNASFYTWLYRITTNLCIDFVRKRDRRPTVPFEEAVDPDADADVEVPPSNQPLPTDEAQRKELREQIDAALQQLSPEHRAVIQLREYEGLQYAEIAKVLGCSIGTVMSRLHYARKNLQKLLKEVT